jgi:ribonucleoside-diphosphate reductase alpha chain
MDRSVLVPTRTKLSKTRCSLTQRFQIADVKGYVTAGMYPDGRLGEVFVSVAKEGSTLSGMVRAWAIAVSLGLQYGIPLRVFVDKYKYMSFEPSGFTGDHLHSAKSIVDYVFSWLEMRFPDGRLKGVGP